VSAQPGSVSGRLVAGDEQVRRELKRDFAQQLRVLAVENMASHRVSVIFPSTALVPKRRGGR
jgi:hypothetical protein